MPKGVYKRPATKMPIAERKAKNAARTRALYASSEHYRRQQKSNKLQNAYGITLEQYEMWSAHNADLCTICNKPEVSFDKRAKRLRLLAVDHDEITGLVRGLLCSICNRGLGMFRHDVTILAEAIEYINYFNKVTVPGVQSAADPL